MFDVHGARVLGAGGSSGVGLATAGLLIECGATVVINGRDPAKLERAAEALGPQASVCAFDVTDPCERSRALRGSGVGATRAAPVRGVPYRWGGIAVKNRVHTRKRAAAKQVEMISSGD